MAGGLWELEDPGALGSGGKLGLIGTFEELLSEASLSLKSAPC